MGSLFFGPRVGSAPRVIRVRKLKAVSDEKVETCGLLSGRVDASFRNEEAVVMDLIDHLREIAAKIPKIREHLKTEEATKNALVLPFISALGYNVFDPTEVCPEFAADVGTKKGEKVDYAILNNESPRMLIECKAIGADLAAENPTQLYRYFTPTLTQLAALTNGINYRFYSDLDRTNVIDKEPFFEFSMEQVTAETANVIENFAKEKFDLAAIREMASNLKYTNGIKRELAKEWVAPSEDVVKLLTGRVYRGRLTQGVLNQFAERTRRAFQDLITEKVNEQLEKAKVPTQAVSTITPPSDTVEATRDIIRRKFWTTLLERARTKTDLHAGVSPNDGGWVAAGAGTSGLGYVYVISKHESNVQLYIDRGKDSEEKTRAMFDSLKVNQQEIERLFGEPLSWEPLEGKRAKRIAKYFELGGYRDDEAKWREIQDAMIGAMVRLDDALRPYIAKLKAGA